MVKVKTPPKDLRLSTTTGHVLRLPASSEVSIPEPAVKDALAAGCALVDDDYEVVEEKPPQRSEAIMRQKREDALEVIIKSMMEDKKPNEWLNDGRPDAKALSRRYKAKVEGKLRDKVWNERFRDS